MRFILLLCGCSLSLLVAAQSPAPCGTASYRSVWLQKFQSAPSAFAKNEDSLLIVPLSIHLVGTDEGEGYISEAEVVESLCQLNKDFASSNIQFQRKGDWYYLDNTAYYNHTQVLTGAQMMFAHNIPNTLNVYFVDNPAGNCGYNLPYAGIAMNNGCSGADSKTFAHEVGHAFSLPHPFLGWEGGVGYDNEIEHDYSEPAPERVLYDYTFFQDTLILDTLIIDTALVERVDQSNCLLAADGFCDTAPDYLGVRWTCNNMGQSDTEQTDPTGAKFFSDGSLIMGYANDACQTRFTDQQIAAMRANLLEQKANLLDNADPLLPALADQSPEQYFPLEDDVPPPTFVYFEWEAVANAEYYILEISEFASFTTSSTLVINTPENTYTADNLAEDERYYWRVRAYNSSQFCAPRSDRIRFETGFSVAVTDIAALSSLQLSPQPVGSDQALTIHLNLRETLQLDFQIYDLLGRSVLTRQETLAAGPQQMRWQHRLSAGTYFLSVQHLASRQVYKVMVQ